MTRDHPGTVQKNKDMRINGQDRADQDPSPSRGQPRAPHQAVIQADLDHQK